MFRFYYCVLKRISTGTELSQCAKHIFQNMRNVLPKRLWTCQCGFLYIAALLFANITIHALNYVYFNVMNRAYCETETCGVKECGNGRINQ